MEASDHRGHFFALSELDSEAPSFRCLSNLVLQVVRLVIAAELAYAGRRCH
jgi:hypothetical protein